MKNQNERKMSNSKHVIDLIPSYVLGCLDDEEERAVSLHIKTCKTCRKEIADYQSIAYQLAHTVPIVEPPIEVKARVMEKINPAQADSGAATSRKWGWFKLQLTAPLWPSIAAVLIIVLGAGNLVLLKQVRNLRTVTQSIDTHLIELGGAEGAPAAHGYIYVSEDGKQGTLIAENLPVLDLEHQYQLWLIQDGSRTSGGVFSVSEDGYGSLRIVSTSPLNSYSSFGVSTEPVGGSPTPTGAKVLGGAFHRAK